MARIKLTLTRALLLYLALLPLFGLPADARAGGPAPQASPPFDPTRPVDPSSPGGGSGTVFTPTSRPVTVRAYNGFSSDATPGLFNHQRHSHSGGVVSVDSPWGERLSIRYWLTPHGVTFEYDDDLKVRYRFGEDGTLEEIVAETPDQQAQMAVGNRAELALLGQLDLADFDMSAYVVIQEALRSKHSEAFLAGLGQFDGPAEVSCTTQGIQCVTCVIGWAISVGVIADACIVAGVPTLGLACLLAIAAHEATNFACAATCIEWAEDCFGRGAPRGGGPFPQGCEP